MYMFKKIKVVLSIFILTILSTITISLAANVQTTDDYKKWENLTDEEKKNEIQPMPYSIDIENSIKNSNMSKYLELGTSLGDNYDLREDITINVKNQQTTNWCWAFSMTSVLETNLSKTTTYKSLLFSPKHMAYATTKNLSDGINYKGYNKTIESGANPYISLAYCVSGNGPVLESQVPFDNNETELTLEDIDIEPDKKVNEYREFASIYKEYEDGKVSGYTNGVTGTGKIVYTEEQVEAARNKIKEHIKKYGAITGMTHSGENVLNYMQAVDTNLDGKNDQFTYNCNNSNEKRDHQITIIGWDDNFSKDYFKIPAKNDGAYIVLNSWGDELLPNGCYYVSYDDCFIELSNFGVVETTKVDYDNIYQYDELGYSYPWKVINATTQKPFNTTYVANVFKTNKKDGYEEYLNEISINVSETSNVEIYVNSADDDKTKIQLVATPGILETGYYTVKLATPIKLTGDRFVVCARYSADGVVVPIELNYVSNGGTSNFWDTATSNAGESFVSTDKRTWTDLTEILKDSNGCVKAFTTYQEEEKDIKVQSVSLNNKTLSMQVGETKNLVATITPTDATNKEVKWTSSNTSVVTVTEEGILKALKSGTANITVTTEDGNKTDICKVTVTDKTTNEDDEYIKEDEEDGEISKDNEINKDQNVNEDKKEQTENSNNVTTSDTTVANTILPYTGVKIIIIISILIITGITIVIYIRYRNFKDIK